MRNPPPPSHQYPLPPTAPPPPPRVFDRQLGGWVASGPVTITPPWVCDLWRSCSALHTVALSCLQRLVWWIHWAQGGVCHHHCQFGAWGSFACLCWWIVQPYVLLVFW